MLTDIMLPLMKLVMSERCQPSNRNLDNPIGQDRAELGNVVIEVEGQNVGTVVAGEAIVPGLPIQITGDAAGGGAVAFGIVHRLGAGVDHTELQALGEPAVGLKLQRVVAGIALEDLLRDASVALVRGKVVVAQRCRRSRLRVLILRQELRAVGYGIEVPLLAQVTPEAADISDVDDGAEADFALDFEVDLVGRDHLRVRIDIAGEAAGREQARRVGRGRDRSVVRGRRIDGRRIKEEIAQSAGIRVSGVEDSAAQPDGRLTVGGGTPGQAETRCEDDAVVEDHRRGVPRRGGGDNAVGGIGARSGHDQAGIQVGARRRRSAD